MLWQEFLHHTANLLKIYQTTSEQKHKALNKREESINSSANYRVSSGLQCNMITPLPTPRTINIKVSVKENNKRNIYTNQRNMKLWTIWETQKGTWIVLWHPRQVFIICHGNISLVRLRVTSKLMETERSHAKCVKKLDKKAQGEFKCNKQSIINDTFGSQKINSWENLIWGNWIPWPP